jgi:hypothetical protein
MGEDICFVIAQIVEGSSTNRKRSDAVLDKIIAPQ